MEKEFIPYRLALELKELGLNEPCFGRWIAVTKWETSTGETKLQLGAKAEGYDKNQFLAPTFATVFKWFREKHDLLIHIEKGENPINYYPVIHNVVSHKYNPKLWFATYEEAELACLKQLIEHVKIK